MIYKSYSTKLVQKMNSSSVQVVNCDWPAFGQQVTRHPATHVADANDIDPVGHVCMSRFDLEIDIKIPRPSPSVTMAVPP